LGFEYIITSDKFFPKKADQYFFNYSNESISHADFFINPHGLLSENKIQAQDIDFFSFHSFSDKNESLSAFFSSSGSDFPFDLFAAAFYLLSRYEEYLPHKKDEYGRFAHENSIAFQQGWLRLPLINIWINEFRVCLQNKFPGIKITVPDSNFILTYDIDMAWSFLHKGWIRNIGGFIKKPSKERLSVLFNKKQDPFDSYDFLDALHEKIKCKIIYFFLLAKKRGKYDKNTSVRKMKNLIQRHDKKYTIGIHPSWASNSSKDLLLDEINTLNSFSAKPAKCSRQHYIKMDLPSSYQRLISCGIKKDYSMGYGSINGFRASFAGSFNWYDLSKESSTSLRIYPFCFMDANSHYEQSFSLEASMAELNHYFEICKKYNGLFISIFHNNFLGTSSEFAGWSKLYQQFISQLRQ
jgi:hypothetical protein